MPFSAIRLFWGGEEEKLSFWDNVDADSETERRKAWQQFVTNNRRREIHVDGDAAISYLCDEINDAELSRTNKLPSVRER